MASLASEAGWRDAYASQITELVAQYKRWRTAQSAMRVEVPGRRFVVAVRDLDDDEIGRLSRREAEIDLNRAINQERESEARARRRLGEAA
jgi:hypothetical protein